MNANTRTLLELVVIHGNMEYPDLERFVLVSKAVMNLVKSELKKRLKKRKVRKGNDNVDAIQRYTYYYFRGQRVLHGRYKRSQYENLVGFYKHGLRHGTFQWITFCGMIWKECFYENGLLEGEMRIVRPNRQNYETCPYKNGKRHGERKMYSFQAREHSFYESQNGHLSEPNGLTLIDTRYYEEGREYEWCLETKRRKMYYILEPLYKMLEFANSGRPFYKYMYRTELEWRWK